jgi:exonuclease SbcD
MRLIHISDTHLGYSFGTRISETGINQRTDDVMKVFDSLIRRIIEMKPDILIHSGDLFDSVRPNNRVTDFTLERVRRLSEAGIETVLLSGNHSTPKLRETGSIFTLFDPERHRLPHIHPIYKGKYEKVEIGNTLIHCIPHSFSLLDEVEKVSPVHGYMNIMTFHAGIETIQQFSHELNEVVLPESVLHPQMDYIALGHYHRSCKVRENAYYAGSIDRFSFNEVHDEKVFLEVCGDPPRILPHRIEGLRPMVDLSIDCSGLGVSEVISEIEGAHAMEKISDAIVRLTLNKLGEETYRALNFHKIREIFSDAMYFKLEPNLVATTSISECQASMMKPIIEQWDEFIKNQDLPKNKERVALLGRKYLERGENADQEG